MKREAAEADSEAKARIGEHSCVIASKSGSPTLPEFEAIVKKKRRITLDDAPVRSSMQMQVDPDLL